MKTRQGNVKGVNTRWALILCCCIISHSRASVMITEEGKETLWIICTSIIIKGSSLLAEMVLFSAFNSSHFNSHGYIFMSSLIWSCYMWRLQTRQNIYASTQKSQKKMSFLFLFSSRRLLCFTSWCGWFWLRKINVCFLLQIKIKVVIANSHSRKQHRN